MKVTIMGLGLHGGGLASARFFASNGAEVTVTDLRSRETLAPTLDSLKDYNILYTLGEHRKEDFFNSDLVIKNPAVPATSPFLKEVRQVETDISIFLRLTHRPVFGITGSKGKSTTSSAIHAALLPRYPGAKLGGNITVSPLTFLEEDSEDPVVLELSSWQLADLRGMGLLAPEIAIITNILPDHQDRYNNMFYYVEDKKVIYENQGRGDWLLCNFDQEWGQQFYQEARGETFYFSESPLPEGIDGVFLQEKRGILRIKGTEQQILPANLSLKGEHNRLNLLCAAAALYLFGLDPEKTARELARFKGIEHRMEFVRKYRGITFYNDSAATIPEATLSAVRSFTTPLRLIMGGTDKELNFQCLKGAANEPRQIYLLDGSAREKIKTVLRDAGVTWKGPFSSLKEAFESAVRDASRGDSIILSPGCTSFGMFLNEFDRGRQFKTLIEEL
ncbi:MAG: UDP-N-acetylmuramoyl-L-alanine--D-glutamate ligase [Spirochaetales bacterium]|nr:UDP-N-acetylmuramoyl-L-alanine--D-glutamate ligase [Spirochaetales bacterium]